jgi:hypothetical protein
MTTKAEPIAKSAFERIQEIEREIISATNLKALLEVNLQEAVGGQTKDILLKQKRQIETRILFAQIEVAAIEAANFAEVARARRDAKYKPVPPPRKTFIAFVEDPDTVMAITR